MNAIGPSKMGYVTLRKTPIEIRKVKRVSAKRTDLLFMIHKGFAYVVI